MKIERISKGRFLEILTGLSLLALGGGIIFAIFITPGNQLFLALLGGMLAGWGGRLILSAK